MIKKSAMSALGYAIILVIILGVVMIISSPMLVGSIKKTDKKNSNNIYSDSFDNSTKEDKYDSQSVNDDSNAEEDKYRYINQNVQAESSPSTTSSYSSSSSDSDYKTEMMNLERKMLLRFSDIEQKQNDIVRNMKQQSESSDNYVCSIEGILDKDNNVIAIDKQTSQDLKSQKFVFVCQYR